MQLHLYCTQNPDYTDTLTDQDTQSDTLSAHLKLSCTNLRGQTATHATLSGFLFVVSEVGLACRVARQARRDCNAGTPQVARSEVN